MTNQFILHVPKDIINYPQDVIIFQQKTLKIQLKYIKKKQTLKTDIIIFHRGVSSLTGIALYIYM